MYNIEIYPEDIDPENLYFKWHCRTKMQHIYQGLMKE